MLAQTGSSCQHLLMDLILHVAQLEQGVWGGPTHHCSTCHVTQSPDAGAEAESQAFEEMFHQRTTAFPHYYFLTQLVGISHRWPNLSHSLRLVSLIFSLSKVTYRLLPAHCQARWMLILCPCVKLDCIFEKQVIFAYLYIFLICHVYTQELYKLKLGKIYLVKYSLTVFSFQNHLLKSQYQLLSGK